MISNISLRQFRSYLNQSFEFNEGVNIIVGPNGVGKTNLLEAIHLVSTNKTFRSVSPPDLLMNSKDFLKISSLDYENLSRQVLIKKTENSFTKNYSLNDVIYSRLPLDKSLPVVLFEPSHLAIFSGSPEKRRKYFDDMIEKISPEYSKLRSSYARILSQRNSLLKRNGLKKDDLFAWSVKLSEFASHIVRMRHDLVEDINKSINDVYNNISGNVSKYFIEIKYISDLEKETYGSSMLKKLQDNIDKELLLGFTYTGPHKEDFKVFFNNKDSTLISSRGENRTLVLALKTYELNNLKKIKTQKPILLLDDVYSELDGKRRKYLTKLFNDTQTFITTTDSDLVIKDFSSFNIITIKPD